MRPALLFALSMLFLPAALSAQAERFFRGAEGFTRAKDLPEDFSAVARSIQLVVKDVMEGSTVHSEAEAATFEVVNKLHIESRPGTIRRRLLFREGETVTKALLLETETALRSEQFLADAIIEAKRWDDGSAHIIVTTYDQWTTTLAFTPSFVGGRFFYNAGVVESNVLGTGQRLGFFRSHGRERDMNLLDYGNNALTPWRLRLGSHFAWLTDDGYSAQLSLSKPLESRADRWAFALSWSAEQLAEFVYFDANRLGALPDSVRGLYEGGPAYLYKFEHVATHEVAASVTRSFGSKTKFNVSPTLDWKDRYNHGRILRYRVSTYMPFPDGSEAPETRYDWLGGVSLALYQYGYKTVHNYRNLKWSETVQTGWRLSTKASQNQYWLGARNSDFYLSHAAVYNNAWMDAFFLNTSGSVRYFISPEGAFDNGWSALSTEVQWKPLRALSSAFTANYGGYFAAEGSHQVTLGEDSGLNGYPNAYYAGQSSVLFEAEQRWFPGIEFGTLVPALALFGNAGNTFTRADDLDLGDLHYALGMGLRLGLTKTTQKLVYHLNLGFPVDEPELDGPTFSFRVKQGL